MSDITILSNEPLVLVHTDSVHQHLKYLLLEKLKSINSAPFEFLNNKNKLIKEKYRFSYPMDEIFANNEISSILKEFARHTVPKFLIALKKEINEDGYLLKKKERLRYCLRIRLFEDKKGYSLQPHKDSEDTIYSFIFQLDSNNTKTAIYNAGRQFILEGNFSNDTDELTNQVSLVINKICPEEEIVKSENQFANTLDLWTNEKFFRLKKVDSTMILQEYKETVLAVQDQSIYGICNSRTQFFNSSKLDKANKTSLHGVRPIKQESRKLLIMDLMAEHVSSEFLMIDGVETDKQSHYLIYSQDKCHELTGLLA